VLAGRPYGGTFGVDIGVGDVLTEPPDLIEGSSLLSFVRSPRQLRLIQAKVFKAGVLGLQLRPAA
jgi:hypothetical protein